MLKVRLARFGTKNKPSYKIVVAEARSARSHALDFLGYYDPAHNPPKFQIDQEKYQKWLSQGAQPTEAVAKLLRGEYQYLKYEPQVGGEEKEEGKEEETATKEKEGGEAAPVSEPEVSEG